MHDLEFHIDGVLLWAVRAEQSEMPLGWNCSFIFKTIPDTNAPKTVYSIINIQEYKALKTLPHCPPLPKVQVIALHRVNTGLSRTPLLLQSGLHRELVDGGVGLRGCMIWRWHAVAGFATVVAVPVIDGTIMVFEG